MCNGAGQVEVGGAHYGVCGEIADMHYWDTCNPFQVGSAVTEQRIPGGEGGWRGPERPNERCMQKSFSSG